MNAERDTLTIEIIPEIANQFATVGAAEFGEYRYIVKSRRRQIAEGVVHNPGRSHFSVLLKRIAEDAKQREFERVMET
jgi:hypothetical protein